MSAVLPITSTPRPAALANAGGLNWANKKAIANDNVTEQRMLAAQLGQRSEWQGYDGGHIAFLKASNGTWYVAYSGSAMAKETESAITAILQGSGTPKRPYVFINNVDVLQDFKTIAKLVWEADRDAGSQIGCAEKKLMSYFSKKNLKPKLATLVAFKIKKGGSDTAVAEWVYPCLSCQHCIAHYGPNFVE